MLRFYGVYLVVEKEVDYEEVLKEIYMYLKTGVSDSKSIKTRSRLYMIKEDILLRRVGVGLMPGGRWVKIPKVSKRVGVLKEVHDGHGHYGYQCTWARSYMNY